MTQFEGSSKIENMISNIMDNGFLTSNRYVAEIQLPKILNDQSSSLPNLQIRCSSVVLPGRNISTVAYRIYGPTRQMPYEALYTGEVTLTYMLSRDMSERIFFEKWMDAVVNNNDYKLGFYDDFVGNMAIHVLDRSDQWSYTSLVEEVFPKIVGDITMANDRENEYMTQEITLAFRKYTPQYALRSEFVGPEYSGGSQPKTPKNNGDGLGVASFFRDVRKGAGEALSGIGTGAGKLVKGAAEGTGNVIKGVGEGIGSIFSPKSS